MEILIILLVIGALVGVIAGANEHSVSTRAGKFDFTLREQPDRS